MENKLEKSEVKIDSHKNLTEKGTLEIGRMLCEDRYILTDMIGRGGFGITYKAYDILNQMPCAIKELFIAEVVCRKMDSGMVIPIDERKARIFEHNVSMFVEEAKILKSINKMENVVKITDSFRENGTAYFVMQYIDGPTLLQAMYAEGGRLPFDESVRIITLIGKQLDIIHKKLHIFHRDISPENIMLDSKRNPILIDFGNAKNYMQTSDNGYSVVLKPGFAPVEQFTRTGQGPWTDVYSLAAVFYYMSSGVKVPSSMDRLSGKSYDDLSELIPECCKEISDVVSEALTLQPNDRTSSVSEFLNNLNKYTNKPDIIPDSDMQKHDNALSGNEMPLIILSEYGMETGRWVIPSDSKIIIGRDRNSSNILVSEHSHNVSKQHCVIKYDSYKKTFIVKDISTNGTFIEYTRLEKGKEYSVNAGKKIMLVNDKHIIEMEMQK